MEFTPIRISTIKPLKELTFDLYIFFKEQYLRYKEKGLKIEEDHLGKLKNQKIARFYITDADEENYQAFLDEILDEALNDSSIPVEEKVNIAEGAASTAVERMSRDPSSVSAYRMTKKAAKNLRLIVADNPDALKQIFGKKAEKNEMLIKHCLNVSAMSAQLAKNLDCEEDDLDNISIAGLLHDLGFAKMDEQNAQVFYKKPEDMSQEELLKYRTHPQATISALEKNEYVNKDILSLILSHEEKISGEGYPNKKSKLTLLEEILALVNTFDKKCTVLGIPPKQAIKQIQVNELGNYSLELINRFKQLIKENHLMDA